MKFKVKKLENVATTAMGINDTPDPWKETKKHCL